MAGRQLLRWIIRRVVGGRKGGAGNCRVCSDHSGSIRSVTRSTMQGKLIWQGDAVCVVIVWSSVLIADCLLQHSTTGASAPPRISTMTRTPTSPAADDRGRTREMGTGLRGGVRIVQGRGRPRLWFNLCLSMTY